MESPVQERSESPVLEQQPLQNESAEDSITQSVDEPGPEHQSDPVPEDPADPQHSGKWQAPAENYAPEDGADEVAKRYQATVKKEPKRIDAELKKELAEVEADEGEREGMSMEIDRTNQKLASVHKKLNDLQQTRTETKKKHLKAQEKLKDNEAQFSRIRDEVNQKQALVSQQQAELDSLMRILTFTQKDSEKLQSDIKTIRNVLHKAEIEKFHAQEQKQKQDLHVEHLKKELARVTEQIDFYKAQIRIQADEKQASKEALSEAEKQIASVLMARKQLEQQWNNTLTSENQLLSQDTEIKGNMKANTKEQEQNEMLTMQLNSAQMDNSTTKSQIYQKQSQQEAMEAHRSTSLRPLRQTDLAQLTKVWQTQLMKDWKQVQRESKAIVTECENLVLLRQTLFQTPEKRQDILREVQRQNQHLQSKLTDTKKQVTECEQEIRELQERKGSMESRLSQQKQTIKDLRAKNVALDQDLTKLTDTEEMNAFRLVVLQNRSEKLQSVIDDTYPPVSISESIDSDIQTEMERLRAVSNIVQQVCQECPQHKEELQSVTLALAAYSLENPLN